MLALQGAQATLLQSKEVKKLKVRKQLVSLGRTSQGKGSRATNHRKTKRGHHIRKTAKEWEQKYGTKNEKQLRKKKIQRSLTS